MGKIIWIASFPKSGNTWMRAFLANYILKQKASYPINELGSFSLSDTRPRFFQEASGKPVEQLSTLDTLKLRFKCQKLIAEFKNHDHFVKTHSRYGTFKGHSLINDRVSKGAIYLVRNPLDLVISYAAHLGISIDKAIDAMDGSPNFTVEADSNVVTVMGSWSDHVDSWLTNKSVPRILVRYEDLVEDPTREFSKVLTTLGMGIDQDQFNKAIEFSSFSELAKQEAVSGFRERPPHAKRFFRQGVSGQWNDLLERSQVKKIVGAHGSVMTKLGYETSV